MRVPSHLLTLLGGSFLALVQALPLAAQSVAAPTVAWEKQFRIRDVDEASVIQPTRDGGFIVLGSTIQFGDIEIGTYAIRTDSRGETIWERVIEDWREVMHVREEEDGDILIAAPIRVADQRFLSFLTLGPGGEEKSRWTSIEDLSADFFSEIRSTKDGGYVLAGKSNNKAYLARLHSTGSLRWEREYSQGFLAEDVFENDDGSFVLTGTTGFDAFLLRVSDTGQFRWNTSMIKVHGFAVRQTDEGFIVTGLRVPSRNETEVYLRRFDREGQPIGERSPIAGVQGTHLLEDPDGEGHIILGEATDASGDYNFLLKVDTEGEPVWRSDFGAGATLYDLVATPGGFVVTGRRVFDFYLAKLQFLPPFRRGDANVDGKVDMSDAVEILASLFLGTGAFSCEDAADTNDDGIADMADAVAALVHLFLGTYEIPAPGPMCGTDPTEDAIECGAYPRCGG